MNFFSYLALLPCFMLFSWALLMNWYQSVLSSYL
jgi:hypothetical protein